MSSFPTKRLAATNAAVSQLQMRFKALSRMSSFPTSHKWFSVGVAGVVSKRCRA